MNNKTTEGWTVATETLCWPGYSLTYSENSVYTGTYEEALADIAEMLAEGAAEPDEYWPQRVRVKGDIVELFDTDEAEPFRVFNWREAI